MFTNKPRNLFFIIEGIDNVGKSTLIKNLKNALNDYVFQTLHYSSVKQPTIEESINYSTDLYEQMFAMMLNQQRFDNSGIICDRSHLGEMVYGPIYRKHSGTYVLDIEKRFMCSRSLWDNLFLITLVDKAENVIARDDGLSFSVDADEKDAEIHAFKEAHEKSQIKNKLLVDVSSYNEEKLIKHVLEYISSQY